MLHAQLLLSVARRLRLLRLHRSRVRYRHPKVTTRKRLERAKLPDALWQRGQLVDPQVQHLERAKQAATRGSPSSHLGAIQQAYDPKTFNSHIPGLKLSLNQ
jgi:hypothetical protein